jgi:DNA-binding NarL/FixJ family response regulator
MPRSSRPRGNLPAEANDGKCRTRSDAVRDPVRRGQPAESQRSARSRSGQPCYVVHCVSSWQPDGVAGKREAEVARLVAHGFSNKETGTRLFISDRTVESHVGNILNKLGLNSRVQIASWVSSLESPL